MAEYTEKMGGLRRLSASITMKYSPVVQGPLDAPTTQYSSFPISTRFQFCRVLRVTQILAQIDRVQSYRVVSDAATIYPRAIECFPYLVTSNKSTVIDTEREQKHAVTFLYTISLENRWSYSSLANTYSDST